MSILQAIWELPQRFLMNRALKSDISDEVCVACESADLEVLADRVYRCNTCGYEGGAGYAAYRGSQQRAGYDQLGPKERHQLAVEKLAEAQTLITSGIGDLQIASHASAQDVRSNNRQYDDDEHDNLMAAFRMLTEAEDLIDDAGYLLGDSFVGRPDVTDVMEVATSSMNNILDSRLLDGGPHRKIRMAIDEAEQLEQWCRRAVAHARSNPPKSDTQFGRPESDQHTEVW